MGGTRQGGRFGGTLAKAVPIFRWASSSTRQSNGLLIRRFGVRIPGGPHPPASSLLRIRGDRRVPAEVERAQDVREVVGPDPRIGSWLQNVPRAVVEQRPQVRLVS